MTVTNSQELLKRSLLRAANALVIPLILISLAYFFSPKIVVTQKVLLELAHYVPYLFLLPAAGLAWRFNRSRAFFIALMFAVAHFLLNEPVLAGFKIERPIAALFLSYLVPLNLALLVYLKERGIFTKHGFFRFSLFIFQVLLAVSLVYWDQAMTMKILAYPLISESILKSSPVPHGAIIVSFVSLVYLFANLIRSPSSLAASKAGILVLFFLAIINIDQPLGDAVLFSVAGISIVLALIQDSYFMAYHDQLTSLPGRRALDEQLLKLGVKYVLVMVDIDYFKKFNDRFGHDVGDQVLRFIAVKLESIAGGGKVFRYGGEEFTILFPGKTVWDVEPHLQITHEMISNSRFYVRDRSRPKDAPDESSQPTNRKLRKVKITVSMGVAEKSDGHANPGDVLKQADQALYRAKNKGRNRISR
ncbi:MAG: diguanylate cyclase, partial [Acidiferrobacterales bacterium]